MFTANLDPSILSPCYIVCSLRSKRGFRFRNTLETMALQRNFQKTPGAKRKLTTSASKCYTLTQPFPRFFSSKQALWWE